MSLISSAAEPPPKSQRVAVVGSGYVGLTLAACLAHLGHRVTAIDIDEAKVRTLNCGEIPILEAGLEALVQSGIESELLSFSTSYAAVGHADVVMLCLPTPARADGGLDLRFVRDATQRLGPLLRSGAVVVTKSTVPIGTHRDIRKWLMRDDVAVVSNPEFLREGTAVADFFAPDRIVIGANDANAARRIGALYAEVDAPQHITDPASAELIKYAANSFLATKLSFVNEISRLCDRLGADADAVLSGLGSDHRIGPAFLAPGPGWGGSCFPKDTAGMEYVGAAAGLDLPVVRAARSSNEIHFDHVVGEISRLVPGGLDGATIAVWGVTFKANTDDHRDSPAIAVIDRLVAAGVAVRVFDPAVRLIRAGVVSVDDPYSACRGAAILVVLTEWDEFSDVDLDKVAGLLAMPIVYDTRAVLDQSASKRAGLALNRIGVPAR